MMFYSKILPINARINIDVLVVIYKFKNVHTKKHIKVNMMNITLNKNVIYVNIYICKKKAKLRINCINKPF